MANRPVIRVGVEADLSKFFKELNSDLDKASKNTTVKTEIDDSALKNVRKDVADLQKELKNIKAGNIDSSSLQKAMDLIDGLTGRVTILEKNMFGLSEAMKGTSAGNELKSVLDGITKSMSDTISQSRLMIQAVQEVKKATADTADVRVVGISKDELKRNKDRATAIETELNDFKDNLKREKEEIASITENFIGDDNLASAIDGLASKGSKGFKKLNDALEASFETFQKTAKQIELFDFRKGSLKDLSNNLMDIFDASYDIKSVGKLVPQDLADQFLKNSGYEDIIKQIESAENIIQQKLRNEIEALNSDKRFIQSNQTTTTSSKKATAVTDKDGNIKPITVPLNISTNYTTLLRQATEIADKVTDNLTGHPIEVGIVLTSDYARKRNAQFLKNLKGFVNDNYENLSDENKVKLNNLMDSVAGSFENEIKLNIKTNIDDTEKKVRSGIQSIKKALKEEDNQLTIYPDVKLSEKTVNQLQDDLNKISTSFKIVIDDIDLTSQAKDKAEKTVEEAVKGKKKKKKTPEEIWNETALEEGQEDTSQNNESRFEIVDTKSVQELKSLFGELQTLAKSISDSLFDHQALGKWESAVLTALREISEKASTAIDLPSLLGESKKRVIELANQTNSTNNNQNNISNEKEEIEALNEAIDNVVQSIGSKNSALSEENKIIANSIQEIIDNLDKIQEHIPNKIFDTDEIERYKNSLSEIVGLINNSITNNSLQELEKTLTGWRLGDLIRSKGYPNENINKSLNERSAVIDKNGRIKGEYTYWDTDSAKTNLLLEELEDNAYAVLHTHPDRLIASSTDVDQNRNGDLAFALSPNVIEKGVEKIVTLALKNAEVIDIGKFRKEHGDITVDDLKNDFEYYNKDGNFAKYQENHQYEALRDIIKNYGDGTTIEQAFRKALLEISKIQDGNKFKTTSGEDIIGTYFNNFKQYGQIVPSNLVYMSMPHYFESTDKNVRRGIDNITGYKNNINRIYELILKSAGIDLTKEFSTEQIDINQAITDLITDQLQSNIIKKVMQEKHSINMDDYIKRYSYDELFDQNKNVLGLSKSGSNNNTVLEKIDNLLSSIIEKKEQISKNPSTTDDLSAPTENAEKLSAALDLVSKDLTEIKDIISNISNNTNTFSDINNVIKEAANNIEDFGNSLKRVVDLSDGSAKSVKSAFEEVQKAGRIDSRMNVFKDFYTQLENYRKLGGTATLSDLTGADDKTVSKLQNQIQKYSVNQNKKIESDNLLNDQNIAETVSQLKSLVDILDKVSAALKEIQTNGLNVNTEATGSLFSKDNAATLKNIADALVGLKDVKVSGDDAQNISNIQKSITNLSKVNANQLKAVTSALEDMFDALKQPIDSNSFTSALSQIASNGKYFKDISKVMGAPQAKVANAKKIVDNNGDDETIDVKQYNQDLKDLQTNLKTYYDLTDRNTSGIITQSELDKLETANSEIVRLLKSINSVNDTSIDIKGDLSKIYNKVGNAYTETQEKSVAKMIDKLNEQTTKNELKGSPFLDDYKKQIDEAINAQKELQDIIASHPKGTPYTNEDITNIVGKKDTISDIYNDYTNPNNIQTKTQVLDKIITKAQDDLQKHSGMSKELSEQIEGLIKSASDARENIGLISKATATSLGDQQVYLHSQATKYDKSFGDKVFSSLTSANAQFIGQYFSFQDIIRYGQEAFQTIQKLDNEMVELAKVSNASGDVLNQTFQDAANMAQELGNSLDDVLTSITDWNRLGYNMADSEKLAKATSLFEVVGDNMNQENSQQGLLSVLKGYEMNADDAMGVLDKLNEIRLLAVLLYQSK